MKLGTILRKLSLNLECSPQREMCFICGNIVEFQVEEDYSLRAAKCPVCEGRKRSRDLAKAIVKTYLRDDSLSLAKAISKMKHLSIYEAQASGPIHECLKKLPDYHCSEYFDNVPLGALNESGVRCESLEELTYGDNSFDLVITQDVLEHVANPEKAFMEVYRVLKPDGYHIFTVPFHETRKTLTRVKSKQGKLHFLLPPVYHGDPLREEGALVYTDFGEDIIEYLELLWAGPTEIIIHEKFYSPDVIPYITDERSYEQYLKFNKPLQMLKYFLYNSVVFRSQKLESYDALPADGERFLPWMREPKINYEHLHRYKFASEYVKDKVVLDLACGEGYGSDILAVSAKKVIGIDINEPTINRASQKYTKHNLEFITGSITDVSIEDECCFDVITCFEALEHVIEHEKLISEVKRLLKEDGIFIVSTPDKQQHEDTPDYHNPFHLKELYFKEFKNLLSKNFKTNLIYGQMVFPVSNIFPISGNSETAKEYVIKRVKDLFEFAQPDEKQATYFISISSDLPISSDLISNSYLIDASKSLFELNKSHLAIISKQEAIINKQIAALNKIYNSFGWKALSLFYKLKSMIFRKNTEHKTLKNES